MAAASENTTAALKRVLVTGASSGIGLALCKLLVTEHDCYVYLGSRNAAKGAAALASITDAFPAVADKIEVLALDVDDEGSIAEAAAALQTRGETLYALVNNAGVGLRTGDGAAESIMKTNYGGPKRVTDAMLGLVEPDVGRIVNVASGAASMWLRNCDAETKALYSNPDVTQDELDASISSILASGEVGAMGGYGFSKGALVALTMIQARTNPSLTITSLSPGFIDTPMTAGFGAKLTPEQGCVSLIHCLFGDVTSGWYYGSDALRSPLTVTRDPGTPEYQGEADPDASKYNN
eukprot:CAMPEP_0119466062 /NCGR_PEP_ID=MMETSP1344-20130328/895_1 /TAXON_ID=236787 /ORGANISM="Florenciella parvula, Strain CCMP2471" /LENGTH=293 /DNA_ID=CAMNT_0007498357 /DNA_START=40 /DNA_END=921 /DNA_ORIENTATION=+